MQKCVIIGNACPVTVNFLGTRCRKYKIAVIHIKCKVNTSNISKTIISLKSLVTAKPKIK